MDEQEIQELVTDFEKILQSEGHGDLALRAREYVAENHMLQEDTEPSARDHLSVLCDFITVAVSSRYDIRNTLPQALDYHIKFSADFSGEVPAEGFPDRESWELSNAEDADDQREATVELLENVADLRAQAGLDRSRPSSTDPNRQQDFSLSPHSIRHDVRDH